MKSHDVTTTEQEVVLHVTASTKAGLLSETLLAFADAFGVAPKNDDEPRPEITFERTFTVEGNDANDTLRSFAKKVLEMSRAEHESYLEVKLTLVTDKKVRGELLAMKTGQVEIQWDTVSKVSGPEKNEDNLWEADITLS